MCSRRFELEPLPKQRLNAIEKQLLCERPADLVRMALRVVDDLQQVCMRMRTMNIGGNHIG